MENMKSVWVLDVHLNFEKSCVWPTPSFKRNFSSKEAAQAELDRLVKNYTVFYHRISEVLLDQQIHP